MTYLLLFVIWVALVACVLALVSGNTHGCGRDCKQGRNCTCGRESSDA